MTSDERLAFWRAPGDDLSAFGCQGYIVTSDDDFTSIDDNDQEV